MGHHLMSMQCGLRALGHLSLVFGLLASGALSLAVATDFWLFTTEQLLPTSVSNPIPVYAAPSPGSSTVSSSANDEDDDEDADGDDVDSDHDEYDEEEATAAATNAEEPDPIGVGHLSAEDGTSTDPTVNGSSASNNAMPWPIDDDELLDLGAGDMMPPITAKMHSGLWRTCLYWDETGDCRLCLL